MYDVQGSLYRVHFCISGSLYNIYTVYIVDIKYNIFYLYINTQYTIENTNTSIIFHNILNNRYSLYTIIYYNPYRNIYNYINLLYCNKD